jgi:hypothetical protein
VHNKVLSPLKNRASKGVRPIASVDELRADIFESDQELDAFLELKVVEQRHRHLALTGGTLSRHPVLCSFSLV